MKKLLEAVLVVAVLLAAGTVVYQWRARLAAEETRRRENGPASYPGPDVDPAHPGASPKLLPSERGVDSMPVIKMATLPKTTRRKSAAPPAPGK